MELARRLEQEPALIDNLWTNTRYWKKALSDGGFDTGMSETPIVPIMVGEARRTTGGRELSCPIPPQSHIGTDWLWR